MFKASKEATDMTQRGSGREMEEVKPEREKDHAFGKLNIYEHDEKVLTISVKSLDCR